MFFSALAHVSEHPAFRIGLLTLLSLLSFESSAVPVNNEKASGSIQIESSAPLTFTRLPDARMQGIPGIWETVSPLLAENALPDSSSQAAIATGAVSWLISPDGTHLLDHASGQWLHAASPSSLHVRPREFVYQPTLNAVWFYGDGLYRYRAASHALERFQPAADATGTIHKMVATASGIWIAADNGVFLFDEKGTALKKVVLSKSAEAKYINAVAADNDIWFASSELKLLHITATSVARLDAESSNALPFGALAEMSAVGRSLWLLLSKQHGADYKLGILNAGQSGLNILPGKYHSLQGGGDRLLARHYSTLFEIYPGSNTMTQIDLDEKDLLAQSARNSQVLFVGLSYNYKDGCEIVERGRFDISKGWMRNAVTAALSR